MNPMWRSWLRNALFGGAGLALAICAAMPLHADEIADFYKGHVEVDPVTGSELQDVVAKVMKTPPAVIARAKSFLE